MISERLNFIKRNQKKLRAEDYIHLRDAVVNDGHLNASNIGQHVILPSSFTGSPRFMNEKSQDAMTYVRKFGRPDLFITFTCNPEWPEIKRVKVGNIEELITKVYPDISQIENKDHLDDVKEQYWRQEIVTLTK
ncbi:hypothetical protein EVAR_80371_1 [Eumeta japonica]|uniref:Helitron helicase-like domain-containing protein n=1 Tax=Eumeta variegata TaxID=151549 RepID=A0A4C1X2V0_EUMVA|nr:hypothetical protein EVAR_80371_1 [Eumeta japonica]